MAIRRASSLLVAAVCIAAVWALTTCVFVPPAGETPALRSNPTAIEHSAVGAAALGAVAATLPEAAHAANQGYAVLQLGWAIFIIGLGPATLFWIYFNKPELL